MNKKPLYSSTIADQNEVKENSELNGNPLDWKKYTCDNFCLYVLQKREKLTTQINWNNIAIVQYLDSDKFEQFLSNMIKLSFK